MGPASWEHLARDARLPHDATPLVMKDDYAVARSLSQRMVFRIGLRDASSFDLNPSDVAHAHRIAVDMATQGLNVLAPLTPQPTGNGPYWVSSSPLAIPLMEAPWVSAEATTLGRDLRDWSDYSSPLLPRLDVPAYVRARARNAISIGGTVAAAGEWCLAALDALNTRAPFTQLVDSRPGTIHGDIHPGNLVRHNGRILLIDLDSVKAGPAMFDIAVGLLYERRFNPGYPGTPMATGYLCTGDLAADEELTALQEWKELSSYSQLLLRWNLTPAVRGEFWNRTKSSWGDRWTNVIETPVLSSLDWKQS